MLDHLTMAQRKLAASEFEFHLTGSRFFETATADSDWDYLAADVPGIHNWLLANGFKPVAGYSRQGAAKCNAVYLLEYTHVQVVPNIQARLRAQNLIKNYNLQTQDKLYMKRLWEALLI